MYSLAYKCVLCGNIMTAIIRVWSEAGPHASVLQMLCSIGRHRLRHYVFQGRSLQSLHWPLIRLCSQMLGPQQSLHLLLMRLCSQIPAPPQSLHPLPMHAPRTAAAAGAAAQARPSPSRRDTIDSCRCSRQQWSSSSELPGSVVTDAGMDDASPFNRVHRLLCSFFSPF